MSSPSELSPTFNDFLFAIVSEERDETPLSVVSALARLDLDPWTEAAELARMPADGAARRLSSLLAGVVHDPPTQSDRATIAARLVGLLPAPANTSIASRDHPAAVLTGSHRRAAGIMCLIFLASIVASLAMGNLAPRAGARGPTPGPTPVAAARR
jgi:hypothetical protein